MGKVFAIGGLGGSGTRVIAKILQEAGLFIGNELNEELDNLVFISLFKNPACYKNARKSDLDRRYRIFERYMSGKNWTLSQSMEYFRATQANPFKYNSPQHHLKIAAKHFIKRNDERLNWGWKEPNTQIFLESLINYFPDLKYIHVIRHGLDMAFSANKQQLFNWGPFFGIIVKDGKDQNEVAIKQLEYWIKINNIALNTCNKKMIGKHLILNFNDFCLNPGIEIPRLLDFINIQVGPVKLSKLINIPSKPSGNGRYKNEDLTIFTQKQLDEVEKLGFKI
ncbi:MAG: sulfotransferase [Bacteroidales bacterium]|nr:sulfotransferase [Bacteroidales bacterium]MCF8405860.1 sulfotransferase [Bacteroidales bacterium]